MNVRNNFLWSFLSICLFFFVCFGFAFRRFLPFIIQDKIYQCQTLFHTISLNVSPAFFRTVMLSVALLFVGWLSLHFLFVLYRIRKMHGSLASQVIDNSLLPLVRYYKLEHRVLLVQSNKLFCFCFGFIQPKIYISTAMVQLLNERELAAVLLHEKYHLENKDSLVLFFVFVIELLFPFFPIISDLLVHFRVQRELWADQFVVGVLGEKSQLISVLKKMLLNPSYAVAGTAPLADTMLETRIKYLVDNTLLPKKLSRYNLWISFLSIITLFFVTATPVTAVASTHTQQSLLFCSSTVRISLPFSWAIDK